MITKFYRKKGLQPMFEWAEGMNTGDVSISQEDRANGSPKKGDMIALTSGTLQTSGLSQNSGMRITMRRFKKGKPQCSKDLEAE